MTPLLAYFAESDMRLALRLHTARPPRWVRLTMIFATRVGDGWGFLAAGLWLLGLGRSDVVLQCASAAALACSCFMGLKRGFRRPRPCDAIPDFEAWIKAADRFSFPSGHSINAFAISTVIAQHFPAAAPALALLAGTIALSRVVLGLHYVTDVLVGAALGAVIGWGAVASWPA
jgi:undecaprenyl-diphosphatase